jgi:flagellar basal body-associated protein FliL
MLLLRKNKKFITVIIALIIIVLLFSVVAIVALYTSPQQNLQQIDPAAVQALIQGSNADINIQGNTFKV